MATKQLKCWSDVDYLLWISPIWTLVVLKHPTRIYSVTMPNFVHFEVLFHHIYPKTQKSTQKGQSWIRSGKPVTIIIICIWNWRIVYIRWGNKCKKSIIEKQVFWLRLLRTTLKFMNCTTSQRGTQLFGRPFPIIFSSECFSWKNLWEMRRKWLFDNYIGNM